VPLFQNSELLPESQIFQEQLEARAKESERQNRGKPQQTQHEPVSHGDHNAAHTIHLIDLTADHYFGERQHRPRRSRDLGQLT
jgi:hypothetical protein